MNANASRILDAISAISAIAKQPMDVAAAERIADFNEGLQPVLEQIEMERMKIISNLQDAEADGDEEKEAGLKEAEARLQELSQKEFELPAISFGEFKNLTLTPEQVVFLKRLKVW